MNNNKYIQEYKREMMEQLNIRVLKRWNLKKAIAAAAEKQGTNSRQYILNAIFNELKKDDCLPEEIEEARDKQ